MPKLKFLLICYLPQVHSTHHIVFVLCDRTTRSIHWIRTGDGPSEGLLGIAQRQHALKRYWSNRRVVPRRPPPLRRPDLYPMPASWCLDLTFNFNPVLRSEWWPRWPTLTGFAFPSLLSSIVWASSQVLALSFWSRGQGSLSPSPCPSPSALSLRQCFGKIFRFFYGLSTKS